MVLEPSVVRAQLERIERSATFSVSARIIALLRFLVEKALNGQAASLRNQLSVTLFMVAARRTIRELIQPCVLRRADCEGSCKNITHSKVSATQLLSACPPAPTFQYSKRLPPQRRCHQALKLSSQLSTGAQVLPERSFPCIRSLATRT